MTSNHVGGGIGPPGPEKSVGQGANPDRRATEETGAKVSNALVAVNTRSRSPEPPYCWQSKEHRRRIRDDYDGESFGACCLGVYDALTEIASDEQTESFTTLQSHIAKKACLGVTTVKKALPELRRLGVIKYETPKLRGPITFTLVASCPTIDATRPALATSGILPLVATVEESKKNLRSNLKKKAQEVDSDFIAQQQVNFPHLNIEQEAGKARAWISARPGRRMTRRFFVGWLNNDFNNAQPEPALGKKEEW